jgi:hypothetical protein
MKDYNKPFHSSSHNPLSYFFFHRNSQSWSWNKRLWFLHQHVDRCYKRGCVRPRWVFNEWTFWRNTYLSKHHMSGWQRPFNHIHFIHDHWSTLLFFFCIWAIRLITHYFGSGFVSFFLSLVLVCAWLNSLYLIFGIVNSTRGVRKWPNTQRNDQNSIKKSNFRYTRSFTTRQVQTWSDYGLSFVLWDGVVKTGVFCVADDHNDSGFEW